MEARSRGEYREEELPSLRSLWVPIWVFDPEVPYIHWGNDAALAFWEATSQQELQARDFTGMSEASRARLRAMIEQVAAGHRPVDPWTFYPLGKPKRVQARRSAFRFQDGRLGLLTEALPVEDPHSASAVRALEALNYLSTMVTVHDAEGRSLLRNPAALQAFGPVEGGPRLGEAMLDLAPRERLRVALQGDEVFLEDVRMQTRQGPRWHRFEARWTSDPISGQRTVLTHEVCVDATHQAMQHLEQARAEAERAQRARSLFLASVSHELRTPLSGMMGVLELLRTAPLPPEHREHLDLLAGSSDVLLTVINDVLDFTKIDAGQLAIEQIPFHPTECLQAAVNLCALRAREKGLDLRVVADHGLPTETLGDPTRIRQILLNLLTNAIKFTPAGHIEVRAWAEAERLFYAIQDTGIGIDDDTRARLFEPFAQGAASTARRFGGTGLGLAISRRLASLLGGTLTFESARGQGSTFTLALPLPPAQPPVRRPSLRQATEGHPLRVLLVEDSPINRRVFSTLLQRRGHQVLVAEDGLAALQIVESRGDLDIVLMDIQMPVMDGVEATQRIRALPPPRGQIPVIALTADALREDFRDYQRAGFSEYLTKPIDWKLLLATIHRLVDEPAPPSLR
ncbi:MAG: ATP-binding protein [Polyangiaceae bacterium]|nr:ATP-binding protein [Polyangiaceae bacterium]